MSTTKKFLNGVLVPLAVFLGVAVSATIAAGAEERTERVRRNGRERGENRAESRAAAPAASSARPAAAPADPGSLDAFRAIVDRNIFNPNRTPQVRASDEPAPRIETFALVGTLQSEKGPMAFFDSTEETYRKALLPGEQLGDLTVKRVLASAVELSTGETSVMLRVNQQLRRTDGGAWRAGPRDNFRPEIARSDRELPKDATPMPPIPADASEVVRRLMEQRQRQLKQ